MARKLNVKLNIKGDELKKKLNIQNGKDGVNGKDGISPVIDEANIALNASKLAQESLKPLIPTIEQVGMELPKLGANIRDGLELLPEGEKLKIDAIENLRRELDLYKVTGEPHRVIGANRNLYQLLDVNVSGVAVNQSIKWNGTQWIPYTPTTLTSPLTTKGDLYGFSTVDARIPVGTDTYFLQADSAEVLGVKWASVDLSAYVPYTGATNNVNIGANTLIAHAVRSDASDGVIIEASNGTDVGILGAGNTANVTWHGNHNYDTATASTIASFGASKTLQSGTVGSSLSFSANTLELNLGNPNTWSGLQYFSAGLQGSIYDNAGTPALSINPTTRKLYSTNGGVEALDYSMTDGVKFNNSGTYHGRLGSGTEAGYFIDGATHRVYLADGSYAINATGSNHFVSGTSTINMFTALGRNLEWNVPSFWSGYLGGSGGSAYFTDVGGREVYLANGTYAIKTTGKNLFQGQTIATEPVSIDNTLSTLSYTSGKLTSITYASGTTKTFTYNGNGTLDTAVTAYTGGNTVTKTAGYTSGKVSSLTVAVT